MRHRHYVSPTLEAMLFSKKHGLKRIAKGTHFIKKPIKNYIKEFGNFHPKRYRGNKTMREFLLNLSQELHVKQKIKITAIKPPSNARKSWTGYCRTKNWNNTKKQIIGKF